MSGSAGQIEGGSLRRVSRNLAMTYRVLTTDWSSNAQIVKASNLSSAVVRGCLRTLYYLGIAERKETVPRMLHKLIPKDKLPKDLIPFVNHIEQVVEMYEDMEA